MLSVGRPRRHMMTQQQRNNKRQRANTQQLAYLRKMFVENPKPDQAQREEIGRRIDMTPRSVQIWFQNNRAKTKILENKMVNRQLPTITTDVGRHISRVRVNYDDFELSPQRFRGEVSPGLSQRDHISEYAPESSRPLYSLPGAAYGSSPSLTRSASVGSNNLRGRPKLVAEDDSSDEWIPLPCTCLTIGKWQQTKPLRDDGTGLWVQFEPRRSIIEYITSKDNVMHSIKIFVPDMNLAHVQTDTYAEGLGHLTIKPVDIPAFSIGTYAADGSGRMEWQPSSDFSDGTILNEPFHYLSGPLADMKRQLQLIENARMRALYRRQQQYQLRRRQSLRFSSPQLADSAPSSGSLSASSFGSTGSFAARSPSVVPPLDPIDIDFGSDMGDWTDHSTDDIEFDYNMRHAGDSLNSDVEGSVYGSAPHVSGIDSLHILDSPIPGIASPQSPLPYRARSNTESPHPLSREIEKVRSSDDEQDIFHFDVQFGGDSPWRSQGLKQPQAHSQLLEIPDNAFGGDIFREPLANPSGVVIESSPKSEPEDKIFDVIDNFSTAEPDTWIRQFDA